VRSRRGSAPSAGASLLRCRDPRPAPQRCSRTSGSGCCSRADSRRSRSRMPRTCVRRVSFADRLALGGSEVFGVDDPHDLPLSVPHAASRGRSVMTQAGWFERIQLMTYFSDAGGCLHQDEVKGEKGARSCECLSSRCRQC
jgi:hypothetical protein